MDVMRYLLDKLDPGLFDEQDYFHHVRNLDCHDKNKENMKEQKEQVVTNRGLKNGH